jgi:hypothetical protein
MKLKSHVLCKVLYLFAIQFCSYGLKVKSHHYLNDVNNLMSLITLIYFNLELRFRTPVHHSSYAYTPVCRDSVITRAPYQLRVMQPMKHRNLF